MRILLLGGTGFIGQHLSYALAERGHQVKNFARRMHDSLESVTGDFVTEPEKVRFALSNCEIAIHLIGSTFPRDSTANLSYLEPTINLLKECTATGVKVVFFSSGGAVYGERNNGIPITEADAAEPVSFYGLEKLSIERYLTLFNRIHGLEYQILRISNIYGEGQNARNQGIVSLCLRNILTNNSVNIFDKSVVRDFVYVKDVARACIAAVESNLTNEVFNLGTGIGTSIERLLTVISDVTKRKLNVVYGSENKLDPKYNVLNISKISTLLQWSPAVTLSSGIENTWKYLKYRH